MYCIIHVLFYTCTVLYMYCTCTVLYMYCICTVLYMYCISIHVLYMYCTIRLLYYACTVLHRITRCCTILCHTMLCYTHHATPRNTIPRHNAIPYYTMFPQRPGALLGFFARQAMPTDTLGPGLGPASGTRGWRCLPQHAANRVFRRTSRAR